MGVLWTRTFRVGSGAVREEGERRVITWWGWLQRHCVLSLLDKVRYLTQIKHRSRGRHVWLRVQDYKDTFGVQNLGVSIEVTCTENLEDMSGTRRQCPALNKDGVTNANDERGRVDQ